MPGAAQLARMETAVAAVLPAGVRIRRETRKRAQDLTINGVAVHVKWIGEGELARVRQLLMDGPRPDIVVARRMSPGARAALAEARVNWIDETGAAEIVLPGLVVSRDGRAPETADRSSRWTIATLSVAEALLCGARGTVHEMARATTFSPAACTYALRALAIKGHLGSSAKRGRGSARSVTDRGALLHAYAAAVDAMSPAPSLRVGVLWRDVHAGVGELGARWHREGIAWALTGGAAAMVLAPHQTTVTTAEIYVEAATIAALEKLATSSGLKAIDGGRLLLRPFPTPTARTLSTESGRLRLAPWPRVFADVRSTGVRGEEAAEHLREVMDG